MMKVVLQLSGAITLPITSEFFMTLENRKDVSEARIIPKSRSAFSMQIKVAASECISQWGSKTIER